MHTSFENIDKEERNEYREKAIKSLGYYMQTVTDPNPKNFYSTPEGHSIFTLSYDFGKVFHYLRFYLDDNNVPTQIDFVYARTDGPTRSVTFDVTRNDWAQDVFTKLLKSGKITEHLKAPLQTKTGN